MNDFPLISVVILNWNGKEYLYPCLQSVKEQTHPNLEIILVDNASTDGSIETIQKCFNDLQVIVNLSNLGYGGGNNRGIREAKGRYIFVLNSDTEIEKECITYLWRSIEAAPGIGVTTPKILLHDQREKLDAAGLTIYPDGLSIGRGRLESHEKHSQREEVFFGSGCASLFRKEMLAEIGLFDEDFFAYAEDTDLGWRARLAGWKAFYVPEAIVYHHHSKKFGTYSPLKAFLVERNRIWVAWKNFPLPFLFLWPFYTALRYFYQGIGALTQRGASGRFGKESSPLLLISIVGKAFFEALKGFPQLLEKRRNTQKMKRISNRAFYLLFKKYGIKAREIAFKE
ncbi:MAG TPA: glycosyltransferase family 2 protein [Thermodesulfobacteriota bacterium]|nr:glycosyltransferase family 2 protein [Thermodesulfobacteriota bacterium]